MQLGISKACTAPLIYTKNLKQTLTSQTRRWQGRAANFRSTEKIAAGKVSEGGLGGTEEVVQGFFMVQAFGFL